MARWGDVAGLHPVAVARPGAVRLRTTGGVDRAAVERWSALGEDLYRTFHTRAVMLGALHHDPSAAAGLWGMHDASFTVEAASEPDAAQATAVVEVGPRPGVPLERLLSVLGACVDSALQRLSLRTWPATLTLELVGTTLDLHAPPSDAPEPEGDAAGRTHRTERRRPAFLAEAASWFETGAAAPVPTEVTVVAPPLPGDRWSSTIEAVGACNWGVSTIEALPGAGDRRALRATLPEGGWEPAMWLAAPLIEALHRADPSVTRTEVTFGPAPP